MKIAEDPSYWEHLNKYDVIYLDITNIIGKAGLENVVPFIRETVFEELRSLFAEAKQGVMLDDQLV